MLTRGRLRSLSLTKYLTNGQNKVVYGCAVFFHGFGSDIDFKSESFRWMGPSRFKFYSYVKLLNLDKRPCKVWMSENRFDKNPEEENWMPGLDVGLHGENWT